MDTWPYQVRGLILILRQLIGGSIACSTRELRSKLPRKSWTKRQNRQNMSRTSGGLSVGWCIFTSILSSCYDYLSVNRNRNRNDDHDDDNKSIKYQWKYLCSYEVTRAVAKKAQKKIGSIQRDSNPWTAWWWCDALPTELWNLVGSRCHTGIAEIMEFESRWGFRIFSGLSLQLL